RSGRGWPLIRASRCTTSRPTPAGSTGSNAGSPTLPTTAAPRRPPQRPSPGERHRAWIAAWNLNPKPIIWTKTAEQVLDSLGGVIQRINGAAQVVITNPVCEDRQRGGATRG